MRAIVTSPMGHFRKVGRPPRASAIQLEADLRATSSTRTLFASSWHHDIIAAKLEAVRTGRSRRVIINMPPRHLKSHLASVCFPAWCLGHDPSTQLLCVSYAQDLADKLSRDCRQIVASSWYRQLFATRLSAQRQAMSEFETTAQGCRLATSVGGVLTAHGLET